MPPQAKEKELSINEKMARMHDLIIEMDNAFAADLESARNGKPALQRHKMLPKVLGYLEKASWGSAFIESGGLSSIREWMMPNEDLKLPDYDLR